MSASVAWHFDGLAELQRDLDRAPRRLEQDVERVLERGAMGVKTAMVEDAKRLTGHARAFHTSISYDRSTRIGQLGYVIGPDKDRGSQGALGNLLYFGSANNGPVLSIDVGLDAEEPKLITALGDVLGGAL